MHEADFDHDHEEQYARAHDVEGLERLTLASVGIDIGSSTTHLVFSRLTLRRDAASYATSFRVSNREMLFVSPILLTPYLTATRIDFEKVRGFIEQSYRQAGLSPNDIDTGAVVITGEALKKENARPIAEYFARQSGHFICVSAGPHHEALLGAHGSGAVQLSRSSRSRVLNIDIGGGTTKLSLIHSGEILQTAAISIGARLVAWGQDGLVSRLEDAGALIAEDAGFPLALGAPLPAGLRQALGERMAQALVSLFKAGEGIFPLAQRLLITPQPQIALEDVDYLVFSGGVAEYIYGHSREEFRDLGSDLGRALGRFAATLPAGMLAEPAQAIRATVIGASEYTIQVSGTTGFVTGADSLPLHGLKVVPVSHTEDVPFAATLGAAFGKFDEPGFGPGQMLSITIPGDIDYGILRDIARGIAGVLPPDDGLAVINVEQDVAQSLGKILSEEFNVRRPLLIMDGITIGDLDYVDIGKPIGAEGAFPVTVTSLLFASESLL